MKFYLILFALLAAVSAGIQSKLATFHHDKLYTKKLNGTKSGLFLS